MENAAYLHAQGSKSLSVCVCGGFGGRTLGVVKPSTPMTGLESTLPLPSSYRDVTAGALLD